MPTSTSCVLRKLREDSPQPFWFMKLTAP